MSAVMLIALTCPSSLPDAPQALTTTWPHAGLLAIVSGVPVYAGVTLDEMTARIGKPKQIIFVWGDDGRVRSGATYNADGLWYFIFQDGRLVDYVGPY